MATRYDINGSVMIERLLDTNSEAASIIVAPSEMFFQQQHMKQKYTKPIPHATPAPIVAFL